MIAGSADMGRVGALKLKRRGFAVSVDDSRSHAQAQQAAKEVAALGVDALTVRADLAEDLECVPLVAAATKRLGRLDLLVDGAGTSVFVLHARLDALQRHAWRRIPDVNRVGPFRCARATREALAADGGAAILPFPSGSDMVPGHVVPVEGGMLLGA